MGFLQRAKELLGLADEEYYDDDYDEGDDYDEATDDDREASVSSRSVYRSPYAESHTNLRRLERESDADRGRQAGPPHVQMHITEPRSFSEAQAIADRFTQGTPVIMNLTMTDPDLAKRFIDFASGLTYGLGGGLQKVSDRVFMLTPANVDVSDAQRRDLRDRGLFSVEL